MAATKNNEPKHDPFNMFGKTWIIIICLLVFAPAGIYLLWKNQKFDPVVRLILSAVFGLIFLYNISGWISPDISPKEAQAPFTLTDSSKPDNPSADKAETPAAPEEYIPPVLPSPEFSGNRLLKVHFLDVGQADSIVVQTPGGKTLLIDGGNKNGGEFVKTYLQNLGVKELEAVVATHPHEDHIGGLAAVLDSFSIKSFYMPDVGHTTKTFTDMIAVADRSKAAKIPVRVGKSIPTEELNLSMVFLAPNSLKYEELNNYSAVLKITYKDISFLLTGDAEQLSEQEMIDYKRKVDATVLKIGHHGSKSSSSFDFLEEVNPAFAVISCGENNDYGYPHQEVIQNLKKIDAGVLRTDVLGSILVETDGEKLGVTAKK